MDQITIQYQGFHPSEFTRYYLDAKLSDLYAQAPRGSTLRAVFTRKNKTLIASVRVMSAAGHFFATARGMKMREVSHKLSDRLRKQLRRWKTLRVRGPSVRGSNDNDMA
jgi:hypothetical protein